MLNSPIAAAIAVCPVALPDMAANRDCGLGTVEALHPLLSRLVDLRAGPPRESTLCAPRGSKGIDQ